MIEWNPGNLHKIPAHLHEGLTRYVEGGIRPGDGLLSILEDRPLSQVVTRTDDVVGAALPQIYRFLYNNLGSPAWGSPERVAAWIARRGMRGHDD